MSATSDGDWSEYLQCGRLQGQEVGCGTTVKPSRRILNDLHDETFEGNAVSFRRLVVVDSAFAVLSCNDSRFSVGHVGDDAHAPAARLSELAGCERVRAQFQLRGS